MKFTESLDYPMPASMVEEMSLDPDFVRTRWQSVSSSIDVEVTGRTVTTSALIDPTRLPSPIRSFITGDLVVTVIEEWDGEGEERRAHTRLDVHGAPVELVMDSMVMGAPQSKRTMTGQLRVKIPFLGARLESEAFTPMTRLLSAEADRAADWLASRK